MSCPSLLVRTLSALAATAVVTTTFALPAVASPTAPSVSAADDPTQQVSTFDETDSPVTPLPGASTDLPSPSVAIGATPFKESDVHCWTLTVTRRGKNVFGGTLISLTTHTSWCGDGHWIRSHASTTSSHGTAFGWSYEGLVKSYDQYGVNWNQYHAVRQAQFCLLDCLAQSKYLTNDVSVGPAGQVYHR